MDMDGLAVVTLLDLVMGGKTFPVLLLFRAEAAGTLAEGAGVSQGRQNGLADKFRFVGQALDDFGQASVDLETDNFAFHG